MRAANQPQSSTAVATDQGVLPAFKILMALLSTLALLLIWRPAVVHAQEADGVIVTSTDSLVQPDSATATHVVRARETLWGIAARFYGDGHQWTALARRNRISTTGKAPLQVGMKLSVPASPTVRGAKAAAVAAAPADSTVPAVALAKAGEGTLPTPPIARKSGSLSAQTASKSNASASSKARTTAGAKASAAPSAVAMIDTSAKTAAQQDTSRVNFQPQHASELMTARKGTRIGLVDLGDQEASRKASEVQTVFHRDLPDAAEAERRTRAVLRPNTPAPRQAEFESAPFVMDRAELAKGGLIAARVGSPSTSTSGYPQRAIKTDVVEVQAPAGQSYSVGQRLVAVTTASTADKATVIVMPAGVLEIVRVEAGKPSLAKLTRQSGRVEQGQRLLPAVGTTAPFVQATPLASADVPSTVRWIDPNELQPTLSSFVLLAAGTSQGVKAGDEFGLYRTGTKEHPAGDAIVARARIVRSDASGSAAIITKQYQPNIEVGLAARRTARAP